MNKKLFEEITACLEALLLFLPPNETGALQRDFRKRTHKLLAEVYALLAKYHQED